MKAEIKNIFKTVVFSLCLLPSMLWAGEYIIPTSTTVVDGDNFCDGGKCTSNDAIYIEGPRGDLQLRDFDGNGSYITITNKANHQAIITSTSKKDFTLALTNCSYVDLRGDNDPSNTYGIVCKSPVSLNEAHNVWVWHNPDTSDHIKISYLEIYYTGEDPVKNGTGISCIYGNNSNSLIYDTFEIYHNYIHNVGYAGMYLGHNDPWRLDNPYIANFSVHDNLIEDLGAYGITMKGVHADSGVCSIYNNTLKRTGLIATYTDEFKFGIGFSRFAGTVYANIYNNWIEKTVGAGILVGDQKHNVYGNTIVGCGTGNDVTFGHGIVTQLSTYDTNIYDNIIIQPKRYGIYARGGTVSITLSRNLIGDAGLGGWYEMQAGDVTENTGDDANIYHADVADLNFKTWSDDGNYSNDNFSISILKPPQDLQLTTDR